jgi:glyoxylase-like metal-dependent hydrolase (beta-lactamase superfamily II)
LLARAYLPNDVTLTVNAFLVNTGTKLVLIDTGTGSSPMFGPKLGSLLDNLRASGYSPEQVDEIYLTHFHTDHIGGLTRDGQANFSKATVRADVREADFYLNQSRMNALPPEEREDFESAMAMFKPYIAANRFKPFSGETELIPGVRAIPAPGHTPGHTIYAIESRGERMLVWGDLMHVAAIQFPQPSATVQFDWNTTQSAQQRRMVFADAAKKAYFVAAAHIAFPGIGKLRAEGERLRLGSRELYRGQMTATDETIWHRRALCRRFGYADCGGCELFSCRPVVVQRARSLGRRQP